MEGSMDAIVVSNARNYHMITWACLHEVSTSSNICACCISMTDLPLPSRAWEWPRRMSLKAALPYGQLPALEIDGKALCQTLSILRFVGKLAGERDLHPSSITWILLSFKFRIYFLAVPPLLLLARQLQLQRSCLPRVPP